MFFLPKILSAVAVPFSPSLPLSLSLDVSVASNIYLDFIVLPSGTQSLPDVVEPKRTGKTYFVI